METLALTLVELDGFPASTSDDYDLGFGVDCFAQLSDVRLEAKRERRGREDSGQLSLPYFRRFRICSDSLTLQYPQKKCLERYQRVSKVYETEEKRKTSRPHRIQTTRVFSCSQTLPSFTLDPDWSKTDRAPREVTSCSVRLVDMVLV